MIMGSKIRISKMINLLVNNLSNPQVKLNNLQLNNLQFNKLDKTKLNKKGNQLILIKIKIKTNK